MPMASTMCIFLPLPPPPSPPSPPHLPPPLTARPLSFPHLPLRGCDYLALYFHITLQKIKQMFFL